MAFVSDETCMVPGPFHQTATAISVEKTNESDNVGLTHFIGKDRRILEVLDLVERVADTDATILIIGESGTVFLDDISEMCENWRILCGGRLFSVAMEKFRRAIFPPR